MQRGSLAKGRGRLSLTFCFLFSVQVVLSAEERTVQALTLEQCINAALTRNPQVLKAREEIKRTKGALVEVWAQAVPRLSLQGNLQTQDENRFEDFGFDGNSSHQQHTWQVEIRVRQALYSGGKIDGALRMGRLTEETALAGLRTTIENTILNTRKAFYTVLLNRALIAVSEQSVTLLEEELLNQQRRYQVGTVTRFNTLRAEVELANAKPNLIRAKNNLRIALAELARIIALDPPSDRPDQLLLDVQGELLVIPQRYALDQTLQAGFANRSELHSVRQQVHIHQAQLMVDRSGYFPSLNLFGGYDFLGTQTREFGDKTDGYIVGLEGQWNLFDGFETKAKMDQTRARLRSAQLDVDDTHRQIELEIRRAYSSLMEATELIESQKKNIESAEESLRLARSRFNAGAGTQLDVLDSRVALTQARTNELQARYDYNSALASLERATGIGVVFTDGNQRRVNASTPQPSTAPVDPTPEPGGTATARPTSGPTSDLPKPDPETPASSPSLDPTGEPPAYYLLQPAR